MGPVHALDYDRSVKKQSLLQRRRIPTAALVKAARKGDKGAFIRLHEAYCGAVRSVVLVRSNPADTEDLVQDVFLAAWERLGSLRDPEVFGPWILTIARNRIADHVRTRRPATLALVPGDLKVAPSRRAELQEALRALQSLAPNYAEPLAMRLIEDMTGPEIAERTGLTPGSVRVTLHRGMKQLRKLLEADDG
ncbi:MAG: sigma-70 family RNA polymerase sigma factor [Proteobacteria bacterium]|nr:sigma-70 family RNA polymerase sigma factor [Pseudomonadota bacterium]